MSKFESSRNTKGAIPSYDIKAAYPFSLKEIGMTLSRYQELAMRTKGTYLNTDEQIKCAALGIAGESGEFCDNIKKIYYHNKMIPDSELYKELGDILWYIALYCDAKGWYLGDIAGMNIDKLMKRYPNGFNYADANNRTNETT